MFSCEQCGFQIWLPIWESSAVVLGLYDDARFPGRCILALRAHREHFDELEPQERALFTEELVRVGRTLRRVTGASRVNYAVLGNVEPHLHAHLIPRIPATEPLPDRPPWEDPRQKTGLGTRRDDLLAALRQALDAG